MPLRGPEPRSCQSKLGAGEGSCARISAGQPPRPLLVTSMSSLIVPVRPREVERLADAVGREAVVLRGGGGQDVAAGDRRGRIADQHVGVGQHARVREVGAAGADQRRSDAEGVVEAGAVVRRAADDAPARGIQLAGAAAGRGPALERVAEGGRVEAAGSRLRDVRRRNLGVVERDVGQRARVGARGRPRCRRHTRTRSASKADARPRRGRGDAAAVFTAPPAARRRARDRRARP